MRCKILLHDSVLTSWNPELRLRALARYLNDVLKVPHALNVSAVVPAEVVTPLLLDHEDQRLNPLRMAQGSEAIVLSSFHIAEHVPALECIAARAHGAFHLDEDGSDWAVTRWDAIRVTRHLGRFAEAPGDEFCTLECHDRGAHCRRSRLKFLIRW